MKSPAFQFYPADFLAGTAEMDPDEVGIYIRLLSYQWLNKFVRKDKAARLGGGKISPAVLAKFEDANGELRNSRLEAERQKQADYREQQSLRGRAGAESRWNSQRDGTRHASANGEPIAPPSSGQWRNDGSSSSSSSLSSTEDPEPDSGAFSKLEDAEDELPSVFADLTEDVLRNTAQLVEWLRDATQRVNPVITWSEANLIKVVAASCHALRAQKIKGQPVRNRVAYFWSIVFNGDGDGGFRVMNSWPADANSTTPGPLHATHAADSPLNWSIKNPRPIAVWHRSEN